MGAQLAFLDRCCASKIGRPVLRGAMAAVSVVLFLLVWSWVERDSVEADGSCGSHFPYRVVDGHGHDADGDGVGCESNPLLPGESTEAGVRGYDRDDWRYDSGSARSRLACLASEHVDHIVALREAHDSGGASWSFDRKREFANDPLNQWCLDAGVNISKSDGDLAEWSGGSCGQRKFIALAAVLVKDKYRLETDAVEQRANIDALARICADQAVTTRIVPGGERRTVEESGQIGPDTSAVARAGASRDVRANEFFQGLSDYGVVALWKWTGGRWQIFALVGTGEAPGATNYRVESRDVLFFTIRR